MPIPVDLDLTVRGIYDGPSNRDLRMCLFRFDYFDELLKKAVVGSSVGLSARERTRFGQRRHDLHQVQEPPTWRPLCKTDR